MCTVTYLPTKNGCLLTSSRDENVMRPKALSPAVYFHNGTRLIYPKDALANGSWIAVSENGSVAVLLNGAFEKHISKPPYRKSRGLILLDIIAHPQPAFCFLGINLAEIEPFTLVLFLNNLLYEARWDGMEKHFKQLDESMPYIWSSATLYSSAVRNKRKIWFKKWLIEQEGQPEEKIFNFHLFAGDDDKSNSVLMNRNNEMLTVCITCIAMNSDKPVIKYYDVLNDAFNENHINIPHDQKIKSKGLVY